MLEQAKDLELASADSTARSSSDYDDERFGLLDDNPSTAVGAPSRNRHWALTLLALSNIVTLAVLFSAAFRTPPVPTTVVYPPQPDWFPPQIPVKKIFQSEPIFGQEPNNESIAAWNSLLPTGRGWVQMWNQTSLPVMPGLNQSLAEIKALPSVYHQLHCLYSTMRSYYELLDHINNTPKTQDKREVPKDPGWNREHLNHCWDYLRQNIMCAADVTLEWHRYNELVETGWGYEHQCKDWDALQAWVFERRTNNNWGLLRGEGERIPLNKGKRGQ
ncbi:hypothetical protein PspLS_07016 [Pyricularia sp. CBS 133598]|nr:hypothetical protein PspLS_07016 [Pyricularia sp. CBS 133598]